MTLLKYAVRKIKAMDPTGRRWPRYKSGDDASVVFCRWREPLVSEPLIVLVFVQCADGHHRPPLYTRRV